MMDINAAPTKEKNRLAAIDAARGFAIFGIFIVNIGAFSAPYFIYGGATAVWNSTADRYTQALIDMFFQASFYTLFSLLFGFGIQLLKDRLVERNIRVSRFLAKRLTILVGFGVIHAFAIWHGDILLSYGLIGLLLLLFLKASNTSLLAWGAALLGGSVGLLSLALYGTRSALGGSNQLAITQAITSYQSESLITIWEQNYNDWMNSNGGIGFFFLIMVLLPLFLFGMYIARKRWLHEPEKHKTILRKLWLVSLIGFIGLKIGPYLVGNPLWISYLQDNVGGTFSAIFYIISITFIAQRKIGQKIIQPFAAVGRMALTNYLMQSIICFILFYGIGFGLYGSIRPLAGVGMVLVVFIGQIFLSNWWLRRFRFGPFEWLWRSLTYGKRQPLRKLEG
ncbi:DUF418 domain-containing protein [Oceanobacillus sp. FSL W7-1304]|nr:DUF418 domain-containing protein [Oceanobacillus profundus]